MGALGLIILVTNCFKMYCYGSKTAFYLFGE